MSLTFELANNANEYLFKDVLNEFEDCNFDFKQWQSYLKYVKDISDVFHKSKFFDSKKINLTSDKNYLNDDLYEEMCALYKKYIKKKIHEYLFLYVIFKCAKLLDKVIPDSLHIMLLQLNIKHLPVTTVAILQRFLFKEKTQSVIIQWLMRILEPFDYVKKELELLNGIQNFKHWDMINVELDCFLYIMFVGDNIYNILSGNNNITLEQYICEEYGQFYATCVKIEVHKFEKTKSILDLNALSGKSSKSKESSVKVGQIYNRMDPFYDTGEFLKIKQKFSKEDKMLLVFNSEFNQIMDLLGNNIVNFNCKRKAMDINMESESIVYALYSYYKHLYEADFRDNDIHERAYFSLFYYCASMEHMTEKFIGFIQTNLFFLKPGTYWNGLKWVNSVKIPPDSVVFSKSSGINVKKQINEMCIVENENQPVNCLANVFNRGIVFYPIFNVFEVANPGISNMTRNVDAISLNHQLLYMPANDDLINQMKMQLQNVVYFQFLCDQSSFMSTILYHPFTRLRNSKIKSKTKKLPDCKYFVEIYDVLEVEDKKPITQNIFIKIFNNISNSIIEDIFEIYVQNCSKFITILLNLFLQYNTNLINFNIFQSTFFDDDILFCNEMGLDLHRVVRDENEDEEISINSEETEGDFERCLKEISAKLSQELKNCEIIEIMEQVNIIDKTNDEMLTIWNNNNNASIAINRHLVFEKFLILEKIYKDSFAFKSIPFDIKKKLTLLLFIMHRGREKKISENHILKNTSMEKFLKQRTFILEKLFDIFNYVDLKFIDLNHRTQYLLNFDRYMQKFNQEKYKLYNNRDLVYYALIWFYQFSNFKISNMETLTEFIIYIQFLTNWQKKFLYFFGKSNSGKSKLSMFLSHIYNCDEANCLSESALQKEENELNNALLPIGRNMLCYLDEFSSLDSTLLNKVISEAPLSSRRMNTQSIKRLMSMSKLILSNNKMPFIKCNAGFQTRIIAIWLQFSFCQLNSDPRHWEYEVSLNDSAMSDWALQRITRIYSKGANEKKIVAGLYLLIRNLFSILMTGEDIINVIPSEEYKEDTVWVLSCLDPYYKFITLYEMEKSKFKKKRDAVEFINSKHNLKWTPDIISGIVQRIAENSTEERERVTI